MMYLSLAPFSEYQPTSQPQLALLQHPTVPLPALPFQTAGSTPTQPHNLPLRSWHWVCVCVRVLSCFMRISNIATVNALKRRGTAGRDQCLCSPRIRGEIKEKVGEWKWERERERGRIKEKEREFHSVWKLELEAFDPPKQWPLHEPQFPPMETLPIWHSSD